jgi:hypothetical protein
MCSGMRIVCEKENKKCFCESLPHLDIVLVLTPRQQCPDSENTGQSHNSIHDGSSHQTWVRGTLLSWNYLVQHALPF